MIFLCILIFFTLAVFWLLRVRRCGFVFTPDLQLALG